jgi:hypothetical protein
MFSIFAPYLPPTLFPHILSLPLAPTLLPERTCSAVLPSCSQILQKKKKKMTFLFVSDTSPLRMAIIRNNNNNNKYWQRCREKGTLIHCWWECKLVQPLWKTKWVRNQTK